MTRDELGVVSGASIFLLFGGFLFGAGVRNIWRGLSSSGWPKTAGVVVSPELAVLQPGIDSEAFWLPGAGAAFLLFGLAVFILGIPALARMP